MRGRSTSLKMTGAKPSAVLFRWSLAIAIAVAGPHLRAQEESPPAPNATPTPIEESPAPPPAPTPMLPELSQLDQAFNQTGLGKDADEIRARIEMRKLQNEVARDPNVVAAKAAADAAHTDLEKRDRLREYYNLNYGLMSRMASSSAVKTAIEKARKEHLALVAQPRVRPETGEAPAPTPKKKKHSRKGGKHF